MNSISTKSKRELAVFGAFAAVCDLGIVMDSIASLEPRAPDVACELTSGERIGFELTELVDQRFMARLRSSMALKDHFHSHWRNKLTPDSRRDFNSRFSNAIINIDFVDGTSAQRRRSAAPGLVQALLGLEKGSAGTVLKKDTKFRGVVDSVRIHRGNLVGPIFNIGNAGWLGDPTHSAITKKLGRSYDFEHPIELLAYFEWDLLPPSSVLENAFKAATEDLAGSPFRRVWLFDAGNRTIRQVTTD